MKSMTNLLHEARDPTDVNNLSFTLDRNDEILKKLDKGHEVSNEPDRTGE